MRRPPLTGPRHSRLLRGLVAAVTGLALLALLGLGSVQLSLTSTASTAAASAVSLVDDDQGAALFSAPDLTPGRPETACVGLTAHGSSDPGTEVRLSADGQAGALAPYLQVSVERGSVPAGGNCAAFSGAQIWSGSLAQLPGADVPGIATGWHPAVEPRSVYRFTVTLLDDPRAQGLQASASFRWSLTEELPPPAPAPVPAPVPAPAPVPGAESVSGSGLGRLSGTPTAGPTTTPPTSSADDDPTTADAASPTPEATPTETAAAPPVTAGPTDPATPGPADGTSDVVEAPPLETGPVAAVQAAVEAAVEAVAQAVAQAAAQVGETAVAVAHDGQFPVALIGVVAAFLFLQGRLDRRDPKLALARVREELAEYREFPAPPTTETT